MMASVLSQKTNDFIKNAKESLAFFIAKKARENCLKRGQLAFEGEGQSKARKRYFYAPVTHSLDG